MEISGRYIEFKMFSLDLREKYATKMSERESVNIDSRLNVLIQKPHRFSKQQSME